MRFYTTENLRLQEKYYRGKHSSGLEVVIVPKADVEKAIAALDCGAYVIGEIVAGEEKVTLC